MGSTGISYVGITVIPESLKLPLATISVEFSKYDRVLIFLVGNRMYKNIFFTHFEENQTIET